MWTITQEGSAQMYYVWHDAYLLGYGHITKMGARIALRKARRRFRKFGNSYTVKVECDK